MVFVENKLNGESFDIVEDNISKLKELFPEIVNGDNQVDFDVLADLFEKNGDELVDDSEEHYKFTWWGKKEAKRVAKETTTKTLRPVKKDSKNWDETQNIYIEGDNLDALKILLGSYRNRIKMIYIDPPYNTGKDFVYKDNRTQTIQEHLEETGQLSEEGYLFENAKTDGKYHSNWLNMMYPRLYLAKKLLSNDGVIFISIDDNEEENLKKVCNEIFGESNFITTLIWRRRKTQANLAKNFAPVHDYILVYAKNLEHLDLNKVPYSEEFIKKTFKNPDNDPRGPYQTGPLARPANSSNREYELVMPNGRKITAKWSCSQETFNKYVEENRLVIPREGRGMPRIKIFLSELAGQIPNTWLDNIATNDEASKEIEKLFGSNAFFSFPKPTNLIKYLMNIGLKEDNIILDFFSGSATTAHSLFKFNNENSRNCKCILVQLDEPIDEKSIPFKAGFKHITEIGKERIRRAGENIIEESGNRDLDVGFKVFKIDESNFIPWNPKLNSETVGQAILSTADNLVDGRSELDLIYELLLQLNMDLNCPINEQEVNGHKVYVVDNGYALICLENKLDKSIADDLLKLKEDLMVEYCQVILKDNALDDNASINIYETLNTNNVEYYTI